MAIDPSIYSQQAPQSINSPFQMLGQMQQLAQQRQMMDTNRALEQERLAKLAEDKRKQDEADRFNAIIGNPALTRDALIASVKQNVPGHYLSLIKSFQEFDAKAADYDKSKAEAADYAARAQKAQQDVIGSVANTIAEHNYNPVAFEVGLKELERRFPDFAPTAANYRQLALKNGPDWIKEHTDGLRSMADRSTAAKIPGEQADAKVKELIAANTSPTGLTPDQLRQGTQADAQLKVAQGNLSVAQQREAEQKRHNLSTEAAANPLAALNAPGAAGAPQGATGPTGEDFLKSLPPGIAGEVKAYAEGRRPFPAGFALKSPYFQSMIQMVGQYDPTFDAANYNARNKARTDLTSPGGTGGKTINALNTALQHAGKLSDLIEKLDNTNYPLVNTLANPVRTQFGSTAVTNFNAVAPQLAKEIERAWRGTGGSTSDVQALIDSIGKNMGIQAQREALSQFVDLAKGKLNTTETQRDNVLGAAGATIPVLFDQNKPVIEKIEQRASSKGAAASPGETPAKGTRKKNAAGDTVEYDGKRWNLVQAGK